MAFNSNKNAVVASASLVAEHIRAKLRRLFIAVYRRARSFGNVVGGCKMRYVAV